MRNIFKPKEEEHLVDEIKRSDERGNHNRAGERLVQLKDKFQKNMKEIKAALDRGKDSKDFNDASQRLAKEIQSLQYWNTLNYRPEYKPLIDSAKQIRELLVNFRQNLISGQVNPGIILTSFDEKMRKANDIIAQAANKVVDNIVDDKLQEEKPEDKQKAA